MNLELFQKSRELGELLIATDEYRKVQEAEAAFQQDELAQAKVAEFSGLQQEVQTLMQTPDPDQALIAEKAAALRDMQARLSEMPSIHAMNEAQTDFSKLLNQANQILRFIITGQVDEGCTGSCATCGGSCGAKSEE